MLQRENGIRMLAAVVAVAGLILIIYSLLTYQSAVTGSGSHDSMMGMGGSTSMQYYTLANMLLAIGGALMLGCGVLYAVIRQPSALAGSPAAFVQSVPVAAGRSSEERAPPPPVPASGGSIGQEVRTPDAEGGKGAEAAPSPAAESALVLRLLSGDERTIFRSVKDAGGEVLQRDIVVTTKMSEAKVSRVIDRLVEKGLVVKERNGMGNKIRIEIEE
jgi:uncharacterized membrane protein